MKFSTYLVRRLLLLIPVMIGISLLIFTLTRIGGDPATAYISEKMSDQQVARIYEKYHFNEAPWVQYYYWMNGVIGGDLGYSQIEKRPVAEVLGQYFPSTFELALVSMAIGIVFGLAAGSISAVNRDKPIDHTTRVMALAGVSLPIFILGLLLLFVFSMNMNLFPLGNEYNIEVYAIDNLFLNRYTGFYLVDTVMNGRMDMFLDGLWHIILPAITLSFATVAIITRMMRSSMLEVMNLDYVKTARSKGLSEKMVIRKHVRRNALIPTTTLIGLSFGGLLGGAVITETLYSWPGLGRWSTRAIGSFDTASIMAFVLVTALIYVIANLIVDLLYVYLDPRVKLG